MMHLNIQLNLLAFFFIILLMLLALLGIFLNAGCALLIFSLVFWLPVVALQILFENVAKTLFGLYSTQLKVLLEPQVKRRGHFPF